MTIREKVGQLFWLPFYGEASSSRSADYRRFVHWVRDLRIGGLVLVNRFENGAVRRSEPYAAAAFINRMQRLARVPLLVAGDFERGDSMRIVSNTQFPHAMAFAATGDPEFSRFAGEVTARQARALGMPWIFAPVADVNNDPDNPIINIRSYGEDANDVSAHVRAFIKGVHASPGSPVLATAKHFPGHGDTAVDSHLALPVNPAVRERLEAVEFVPFRAAIDVGVDAVMSAHIALPALGEPTTPATLSAAALTGVLRGELKFQGLIVTDALDMQGISKGWPSGQAAVKALEAGADVLLMPSNPDEAIDAVVKAVNRGRISRARLDASVERILAAKAKVGLTRRRFVDLEAGMDELDTPEDVARVQQIADRSVTLLRNGQNLVPLGGRSVFFAVLTEARCAQQGRAFAAEVRRRFPNAQLAVLDPATPDSVAAQALQSASESDVVVVAAFASVTSYRSNLALGGNHPKFVEALIGAGKPVILVALGNPYLWRAFPGVAAYMTTYSTVPPSEIAAAKALSGEIAIRGKLPVTIPGLAKYGSGIEVPERIAAPQSTSPLPSR